MATLLKHEININEREFFIEKVNKPLVKAIVTLGNRYPEPKMENLLHPNSRRLLDIQERYLEYEGNGRLKEIVRAMLRILISKIEHSPNYRDRFSWFVEQVGQGWKSRSYNHPVHDWNEPKPYGGK